MDISKLKSQLTPEEGVRFKPYPDSVGKLTIGIGHNLDVPLSQQAVDQIFCDDIAQVTADLNLHLPWWTGLDDVRQRVIADMAFNEGLGGLLGFHNMLTCLQARDYVGASNEMLLSLWAKQVGPRAAKLAHMMKSGLDPTP